MKTLQILGAGCQKCNQLAAATDVAATALGLDFQIEKITDLKRSMSYGVMATPALVVDGVVKCVGRVPKMDELKNNARLAGVQHDEQTERCCGPDDCGKKMAPILEELKNEYAGRLDVEFIDVWKNEEAAKKYKIKLIPTQIFYGANGKELFRHEGFFGKEDILAKWKELGVKLGGQSSATPAKSGTNSTTTTR